jgi:hypothetical protein
MALRIEQLKKTLAEAKQEAAAWKVLCEQLKVVLGPTFNPGGKIQLVAEDADHRLESLSRKGRTVNGAVPQKYLAPFVNHPSFQIRKVITRLVEVGSPEQFKYLKDISPVVRSVAAQTAPLHALNEAIKKFPGDENMLAIQKSRTLNEHVHLVGLDMPDLEEKPASAPTKDDLSDVFYHTLALKLHNDYGSDIEQSWQKTVVKNYCRSVWNTSHMYVDPQRLEKALQNVLSDREEVALNLPRVSLREVAQKLIGESTVLEVVDDAVDERKELFAEMSDTQFMSQFSKLYSIRESTIPKSLRKYMLSEGLDSVDIVVPMKGKSPTGKSLDRSDEKILDRFVEAWNSYHTMLGEPLVLNWSHDVLDASRVSFHVVLK